MPDAAAAHHPRERETFKAATIGLIISFVVVLVFRGFFFETFHIPTGSMAPTLMGQHLRFHSPHSGFDWAVNPWPPTPGGAVTVNDPSTRQRHTETNPRLRAGDRIAILKYNPFYHPKRWEIVVVKWPASPRENYIKRLVGLPGERLLLLDGDVFISDESSKDWRTMRIARKPDRVQRTLWWPLYSSELAPVDNVIDGRAWRAPWQGEGWDTEGRAYAWTGAADAPPLRWDAATWPVTDWQPYNDTPQYARQIRQYPVGDLRMRAAIRPESANVSAAATITARAHQFRARIEADGACALEMRPEPTSADADPAWTTLATADVPGAGALEPGRVVDVEFWHVDQTLELWIDGRRIARAEYDWDARTRLEHSLRDDANLEALLVNRGNSLANPAVYRPVGAEWSFRGGALTLHRVGLDRDGHYQPSFYPTGRAIGAPALGTHPNAVAHIGADHFFLLGDNSANSTDSRLVDEIDPWVRAQIDPDATLGLVPREMMMGRAVVCFWPSTHRATIGGFGVPFVPDFGRTRFLD